MGIEIERKFLVRSNGWRDGVTSSAALQQGYLSSNAKATVRVRTKDDAHGILTLKGVAEGLSRSEFEYAIPIEEARELLEMARPHVIQKRRFLVPHAGFVWEVDVFEGAHSGLVMAEVELEAPDQPVPLPDWVGAEVSHDDRYANASLSRTPGVPACEEDVLAPSDLS